MKTGLILEGGAVRGIFTAGVLDRLMENGIYFPYVIGASAGGSNALSYRARQIGRTARLMNAPKNETYYGFRQFMGSRKLIDLDKMCYEYPYNQFPLDFDTYFKSDMTTEYVCTCCETGKAEYFTEESDEKRLLTICKATCSIPMLCEPVELDGNHYLDGSIADSIPIERALENGCDRVVIVLTKPEAKVAPTEYKKFKSVLGAMYKKYPAFVDACMDRTERYEKEAALMREMQENGKAFVIRPTDISISKFERDSHKIKEFYRHGYTLMDKNFMEFMNWYNKDKVNI